MQKIIIFTKNDTFYIFETVYEYKLKEQYSMKTQQFAIKKY